MQHRVKEILKLVDTISQWPIEKVLGTLKDMQEILDHNYTVFMTLSYHQIQQTFND